MTETEVFFSNSRFRKFNNTVSLIENCRRKTQINRNITSSMSRSLQLVNYDNSLLSLKLQVWRLLRARSSLTFRQTRECGFTLKLVGDMKISYSQMHRTDKYSQHSSINWPVWLNGWVFVYELSACVFESRCCHLNHLFHSDI